MTDIDVGRARDLAGAALAKAHAAATDMARLHGEVGRVTGKLALLFDAAHGRLCAAVDALGALRVELEGGTGDSKAV